VEDSETPITSGAPDPDDLSPVGVRILEAARAVIIERGLDGFSVQAVATAAGVQKSAIAYHFGSKDGLLKALVRSQASERTAQAQDAVRSLPPEERLRAFFAVMQRYLRESDHWRLVQALLPLRYRNDTLRREMNRHLELGIDFDIELFGLRRDEASRVLISLLFAALEGLTVQYRFRGDEMDLEACFARLEASLRPAFLEAMEDAGTS
jgi:AcrR family transcriptional regulator